MKMQIREYLDANGMTISRFADLLGVNRRAVDSWLARERYAHAESEVRGIGFTASRAFDIERKTKGAIEALYLMKLSSI